MTVCIIEFVGHCKNGPRNWARTTIKKVVFNFDMLLTSFFIKKVFEGFKKEFHPWCM